MLTREDLEMQRELEMDLSKALLLAAKLSSEEFEERKTRIETTYAREVARGEARPRRRLLIAGAALLLVIAGSLVATIDADERVAGALALLAFAGVAAVLVAIVEHDRKALDLVAGARIGRLVLQEPEFAWAPVDRDNALVCLRIKNWSTLLEICGGVLFARTIGELVELIEEPARRHDGLMQIGFNGEIRVLFGTPASDAERLERAVRFAVDLRHKLATREYKPTDGIRRIRIGTGIHHGRVVSGLVGDRRTRSFLVCGKTLELADEIADAAAGGEIFVSDAVHRELEGTRPFTPREPMFSTSQNQVVRLFSLDTPPGRGA